MKKKSLLFVNTDMCWGGVEVSLINLLKEMDYNKYDIHLALLSENLAFLDRLPNTITVNLLNRNSDELQYHFLSFYNFVNKLASGKRNILQKIMFRVLRYVELKLYIISVCKQLSKYDTAIAYRTGLVSDIVSRIKAKKKITFLHNGLVTFSKKELHDLTTADTVICVSEGIRQKAEEVYPCIAGKTAVVHNLSNVEYIRNNCDNTCILSKHKRNLVSCGRLVYDKGFDMLIHALKRLTDEGYDVHLTIVGGEDCSGFASQIYQAEDEMFMKKHITFLGWVDVPYSIMKSADIYIQSSRYEAYGITIREAQVLGLPILSTDTCGGKELISDGNNGMLCEASVDGLYAGIKNMINNPQLLNKISEGCKSIDFENEDKEAVKLFCMNI